MTSSYRAIDPAALQGKRVLQLENLRCHPGEAANDAAFAKALAVHGELYVNHIEEPRRA